MSDIVHRLIGVHGWNGIGKSWLFHTAPGPRLLLDLERGSNDVHGFQPDPKAPPVKLLRWDMVKNYSSPPEGIDENTTVLAKWTGEDSYRAFMHLLESGKHVFKTAGIDSYTRYQEQQKRAVTNPGHEYDPDRPIKHDGWGRVRNHGLLDLDRWEALKDHAEKPIHFIIIAPSDREAAIARPDLQGAIRKKLVEYCDLVGYIKEVPHQGKQIRSMQIRESDEVVAKCRMHAVGLAHPSGLIPNPSLREIININHETIKESK